MQNELTRRMGRDQRHRLLQGYPMAPLMKGACDDESPTRDPARALIVGVLPHPFCNPRVRGCGFCTFPHERFSNDAARRVTRAVCDEIAAHASRVGVEPVEALYIGGGTANLTPPDVFEALCDRLATSFVLERSEVSLEGVPSYFLTRDARLLALMRERLGARQLRVSMGIQTFDAEQRRRMGREAFGDADTVQEVVRRAHDMGFTTSGDLLMNLPGQTLEETLEDIRVADATGLDQICLYHLVLYEGLGTEWSRDPEKLRARVTTDEACARWLRARDELLSRGFVQTTLTNFERASTRTAGRRFAYERLSFEPWRVDGLGFGPGAISTVLAHRWGGGQKWINQSTSATYLRAMAGDGPLVERRFRYDLTEDLALLHLTRGLARGWVDLAPLRIGLDEHHVGALDACAAEGLLEVDESFVRLTPRGVFYADSVTGLLASARAEQLAGPRRRHLKLNDARPHGMG